MIFTGSPTADDLLSKGLLASQSQDSARALQLFGQASEAAPSSGIPHFLMASEHAAIGQMELAEAAFANAVLLSPDMPVARYQLGLLQFSSGRAALALVTWQALLDLPDTDPLPHFVRGFAALAQDDFSQALGHYHAGLERNSHNPPMSDDIRKIIDGIHALPVNAAAPASRQADFINVATHASHAEESDAAHVLISNYQYNNLH